jgi:exopolysaccharide biosynthesis polyprenyl glycosylphosphotransferase
MFARLRKLAVALTIADVIVAQMALFLADAVRRAIPLGQTLGTAESALNPTLHLAVALIFPISFFSLSVYDMRRGMNPVGDAAHVIRAVAVATFVFAGFLYFSFRDISRLLVVYFFFIEVAAVSALRLIVGLWLKRLRHQGRALIRVLIAGSGEMATTVVRVLRLRFGDMVSVVGSIAEAGEAGLEGLPLLGPLVSAAEIVRAHRVDEVIVALPFEKFAAIEHLEGALLAEPVRVRLVPDYMRLVFVQSSVESLEGIPLIGLREPSINGMAWAVKRLFDVGVTTALLTVTWPFMLLIAALIKLDSAGPVIFRQRRVGENGRTFWMYKFRTMVADAESRPVAVPQSESGSLIHKHPEDARITRLGRFLRRTSLDELPQFFNVLRGEMSLVGPRPEVQVIAEQYEPWQRQRLSVPPGMTGWWQVNGRSDLPMHLNTHLDLYYIQNYSLWLDIVILWKTLGVVLKRQGAY